MIIDVTILKEATDKKFSEYITDCKDDISKKKKTSQGIKSFQNLCVLSEYLETIYHQLKSWIDDKYEDGETYTPEDKELLQFAWNLNNDANDLISYGPLVFRGAFPQATATAADVAVTVGQGSAANEAKQKKKAAQGSHQFFQSISHSNLLKL